MRRAGTGELAPSRAPFTRKSVRQATKIEDFRYLPRRGALWLVPTRIGQLSISRSTQATISVLCLAPAGGGKVPKGSNTRRPEGVAPTGAPSRSRSRPASAYATGGGACTIRPRTREGHDWTRTPAKRHERVSREIPGTRHFGERCEPPRTHWITPKTGGRRNRRRPDRQSPGWTNVLIGHLTRDLGFQRFLTARHGISLDSATYHLCCCPQRCSARLVASGLMCQPARIA